MAKDRVQVPDLYKERSGLPQIVPTAHPVDTFVSPNHITPDQRLQELASAFQEIQPGLSRFAAQRTDHMHEIDMEEGHKAAMSNKAQFKDAVNQGVIPAGASPWFRVGWERQKARVASDDFDRELRGAYAVSGLSEQDNPQKFDGWVADFTSNWQEMHPENKDNPEFTSVFGAAAAKSQEALASAHAALRTQKIEADVEQNTDRELGDILNDPTDLLGNRSPDLGARLAAVVNTQVANGLNGQLANKLVASAVVRQAIQDEDVTVLDLLNEVPSGSGTVGQIGFVKDMAHQARERISAAKMNGGRLANLELKAKREELINTTRAAAYTKIVNNPYANTREEFDALNAVDPDEAAKIESFRTSYLGSLNAQNKVIESGPLKTSLVVRALRGDLSEDEVQHHVSAGEIDSDTAKDLLTTHIPKGRENKSVVSDPMVARFSSGMKKIIIGNELSIGFKDSRYALAEQADEMFLRGIMGFKEQKPKATPRELMEEAKALRDSILAEPEFRPDAEPLPNASGAVEQRRQAEEPPVPVDASVPKQTFIFKSPDDLKQSLDEFVKTGGASGRIKDLAHLYKMTPNEFVAAQRALLNKPK